MMNKRILLLLLTTSIGKLYAQNVGVNTATPQVPLHVRGAVALDNADSLPGANAITIVKKSSTVIITNNGSATANLITYSPTPVEGQLLYILNADADTATFAGKKIIPARLEGFVFLNSGWRPQSNQSGGTGWLLEGNGGTDDATNFLGTTDSEDLVIKTSNAERIRVLGSNGNVSIGGITNPDDKLDVLGNGQINGYLKIGNPIAPLSRNYPATQFGPIYETNFSSGGYNGWTKEIICGVNSDQWFVLTTYLASGVFYAGRLFWQAGLPSRSAQRVYSPWIWVPTGVTDTRYETAIWMNMSGESGFDGLFLEKTEDGVTWTKFASPDLAYTALTTTDLTCNANASNPGWTYAGPGGALPNFSSTTDGGKWIRLRFASFQDAGFTPGTTNPFLCSGFTIRGQGLSSWGGAFAAGNVYAEHNVYAGSNVMRGDIAEYFPVNETTTPGDLIAIADTQADSYALADNSQHALLLGVHSTAPTLTLNNAGGVPVALTGRVPVKVSTVNGPIHIGDFLTASPQKGIAMKATGSCYVIGRALENFEHGETKIMAMVQPSWYNPVQAGAPTSGGSFQLVAGQKEVIVNDPTVQPKSRVFVSFRGNAGCSHWISEVNNGRFIVSLGQEATNNVPFDYFVDNAQVRNTPAVPSPSDLIANNLDVPAGSPQGRTNTPPPARDAHEVLVPLREANTYTLPPLPPDPSQPWVWEAELGFMKGGNQDTAEPAPGNSGRDITQPTAPRR
ncbi:MAG: hypothetical protein KF690_10620 [Bacteroidetes bacterium]|nr:hypothetical protein [Bacteroidota bacterium]